MDGLKTGAFHWNLRDHSLLLRKISDLQDLRISVEISQTLLGDHQNRRLCFACIDGKDNFVAVWRSPYSDIMVACNITSWSRICMYVLRTVVTCSFHLFKCSKLWMRCQPLTSLEGLWQSSPHRFTYRLFCEIVAISLIFACLTSALSWRMLGYISRTCSW